MSNADLLSQADRILRPVVKELGRFPWLRVLGCCAGHKSEDGLWLEMNVLGSSGLRRLTDLLKILDGKLSGSDCRVDCLLSHSAGSEAVPVPHGWIPVAVEVFWPTRNDWRRNQALVVEAFLSSIEEFSERVSEEAASQGAINYCPFCSSSFIRLDTIAESGHRYRCSDCDMSWTMIEPLL